MFLFIAVLSFLFMAVLSFLFIAVSINLREILDAPRLRGRVAEALILLGTPVSHLLLIVQERRPGLGLEMLACGLVIRGHRARERPPDAGRDGGNDPDVVADRLLPSLVTCGCLVLAGATPLVQADGGPCWIGPSVVVVFAFGRFNVWVLRIEIPR